MKFLVKALVVALLAGEALAQEPTFPHTLSRPAAERRFERAALDMRMALTQHLTMMADELNEVAGQSSLTGKQQQTLARIIEHLHSANDAPKALEHAVQMAVTLPPTVRAKIDQMAGQLQPQLQQYAALKSAYRSYLASQLATIWPELTLTEKRKRVGQLMALEGEQTIWLLARRPFSSILPLHPSAKLPFEQYSSEKRSWLASSYSRLQPAVTAIERDAVWLAKDPQSTDSTRAAAARLANLLASSYGPSLRGMMLLETDDDLPESLNAKMRALIAQIDSQLALADKANERWLQELDASLKALRTELAAEDRFKDLIVIDTHRYEVARLWRPLRIYARRDHRADHFEDAYLHARRDKLYEVEFLVDGQLQMLARSDVWLNRHESNLPQLLLRQIPSDGPGQPVTATTKLDLEVLCHAARGWQPAHVIDESPFGVEVIWQSTSDPWPLVEPRERLRMVPAK